MIQPKELRIGNLIQDSEGQIIQVESISEFGGLNISTWSDTHYGSQYGGADYEYYSEKCMGIFLTEERLLKLGFTNHRSENLFYKSHGNTEILLFNSETPVAKSNSIKEGEFYYFFHKTIHTVKYVHQLQNLYFILTGNELTIKELETQ